MKNGFGRFWSVMTFNASNEVRIRQESADLAHGFAPVAPPAATVLILGSLPGRMSLEKRQYYGQPRNAFWRIMDELCGAGPGLGYEQRLATLAAAGIALWDVLAAAARPGSLDSAIVTDTMRINDFTGLFGRCAGIGVVFFNGRKSAELYRRRVLPGLEAPYRELPNVTLPSTSPAYAGMPFAAKLERWQSAIGPHLGVRI